MAKEHKPNLAPNGRYRVIINYRTFWCGKDKSQAEKLVRALETAWDNEKATDADGKKCWSDRSITNAYTMVGLTPPASVSTQPAAQPTPAAPQQPLSPITNLPQFRPAFQPREISFHQALDLYVKMRLKIQTIRRAGEDSESYVGSIKHNLKDMPLHSIDAAHQQTIRETILALPPNRINGEPISIITAKKWLQELGAAFEWFSHPDSRIGWIPPYLQWREKFSITDTEAKAIAKNTGDSDYGKVKPTFNLDQLAILFKNATPLDRFYLLGGVCLGWTAIEFATLKRDQVKTDEKGETYIVDKERSKTGVEMTFWVCPELATLLFRSMTRTPANPEGLALMTANRRGKPMPLVHGKTDTIAQSWERLMHRVNKEEQQVPNYPHSRLRKMAGQLIENITGNHDLAQMVLSHKRKDVASTNYVGLGINVGVGKTQQQRLWDAQREVHKALAPVLNSNLGEKKQKVQEQPAQAA
jgi:hypothetical protein